MTATLATSNPFNSYYFQTMGGTNNASPSSECFLQLKLFHAKLLEGETDRGGRQGKGNEYRLRTGGDKRGV